MVVDLEMGGTERRGERHVTGRRLEALKKLLLFYLVYVGSGAEQRQCDD